MPTPSTKSRRPRTPKHASPSPSGPERLQKVLAAAGVASRRECEQYILEGRVEVDREVILELGTKVDPDCQEIRVDGSVLRKVRHVYYLVNKPKGVLSTSNDPSGRPRVIDLIPETAGRVFTVGRLDRESEGLILVTNDGELANRLAHPRYGVEKVYQVQVAGNPEREVLRQLEQGMQLAEAFVRADKVRIKRRHKQSTILEMVLREGRKREIRRMLAAVGHRVQRLRRIAIGPLQIGKLPIGEVRTLTRDEIRALQAATHGPAGTSSRTASRAKPRTKPNAKSSTKPRAQSQSKPRTKPSTKGAKRPAGGAARRGRRP